MSLKSIPECKYKPVSGRHRPLSVQDLYHWHSHCSLNVPSCCLCGSISQRCMTVNAPNIYHKYICQICFKMYTESNKSFRKLCQHSSGLCSEPRPLSLQWSPSNPSSPCEASSRREPHNLMKCTGNVHMQRESDKEFIQPSGFEWGMPNHLQ